MHDIIAGLRRNLTRERILETVIPAAICGLIGGAIIGHIAHANADDALTASQLIEGQQPSHGGLIPLGLLVRP